MLFFLLAAGLTLMVAAAVVFPLLRDRAEARTSESFNAAVYRDQLLELQRDVDRGALSKSDADSARLEIQRRLLAVAGEESPSDGLRRAPTVVAFGLVGFLVIAAGAIYTSIGAPMMPDHPYVRSPSSVDAASEPMEANGAHANEDQLVQDLQRKLIAHPDDADGWGLLARSLIRLDRPQDAVAAYEHAIAASPQPNAELDSEYAEARVIAADGRVDSVALRLFDHLHDADPSNPQARYYIALAKAQAGDTTGALADWRALLADSPKDAPWVPTVQTRIAEASGQGAGGPGPSAADIAAAASMSDSGRQAMIEGMVDRLAARLRSHPDDLEGWRRLARAYVVLGRKTDALAAERQVLRLAPDDADAKAALERSSN